MGNGTDAHTQTAGQSLHAVAVNAALAAGKRAQLQAAVQGHHLRQNFQHVLRHRLVVYRDQVLGLRVDLERLIERQSGFDIVRSCVWHQRQVSPCQT